MTIELKNVAVKVERQRSHECIISIGRLNDVEKDELLSMFPTANNSLRSRPTLPFASPMFQVTITVNLPIIPNVKNCDSDECNFSFFKICDGDMCNLSFMDRMIVSQIKLADTDLLYYPNWFDSDSDDSKTDNDEMKKIRLSGVAIKVNNDFDDLKFIRIGRISGHEKEMLEQILPSNMLHFKLKVEKTIDNYYELAFKVPTADNIKDSNNCAVDISYDESHSKFVCISDQRLFVSSLSTWFKSGDSDMAKVDSDSDAKVKCTRLTFVAVKVDNKRGEHKYIRIGRIGESEKTRLEQMLPSNMLNFKSRTIVTTTGSINYYELDLPVVLMDIVVDSNYCAIDISYDEKNPNVISISDQRIIENHTTPQWFDFMANDETGSKKETVSLTSVAVKVVYKQGLYRTIQIGRISESEKTILEQILPVNMLNFTGSTIISAGCPHGTQYYELDLPASAMGVVDSNNCNINISCYDKKPDSIYITHQRCSNDAFLSPWFLSIAQRLSPPRVSIAEKVYETTQQMISQNKKEETNMTTATLERCIINDNATVLFWSDGTKTVTKTTPGDAFDPEVGIAMGLAKRLFGSKHKFDKYVNAVVSDMYKRDFAGFTEKELLDALAENEKLITKAKAKHKAEKEAYLAAKNDPNHEGKLPVLHSLKGDHSYRFAKIRKDILLAEIEKRKAKKAAKAKAKAKAKKKSDKK